LSAFAGFAICVFPLESAPFWACALEPYSNLKVPVC